MDKTPTREDISSTVALIILLNCFFFNNNAYVLIGVSAWMLIWAIQTKQFKRENFTARRTSAIIGLLLLLVCLDMAAYMLSVTSPSPVR